MKIKKKNLKIKDFTKWLPFKLKERLYFLNLQVKGIKKFKTLNRLEIYLNKVLANPRSPKSDFKILDNAFENVYTDSEDPSENIREMYYDAVSTKKYKDLKFLISDWLSNRVTKETVVATIVIADESNNEKLKIKALKYIHK